MTAQADRSRLSGTHRTEAALKDQLPSDLHPIDTALGRLNFLSCSVIPTALLLIWHHSLFLPVNRIEAMAMELSNDQCRYHR
jgi:hypothetical protein